MSQKVPAPFEGRNDAESFFNELVGGKSTSRAPNSGFGSGFSLGGFSSDSVLNLFRDETNALLKGEISKIKALDSTLELRLVDWKNRLEAAIERLDKEIQLLAKVETPQKKEAVRHDDEEKRPIAFALLKAIKSGLLKQTQEISKLQEKIQEEIQEKIQEKFQEEFQGELATIKSTSSNSDFIAELQEFFDMPQSSSQVEKKLEHFVQELIIALKEGDKPKISLDFIPEQSQALFVKLFLKALGVTFPLAFSQSIVEIARRLVEEGKLQPTLDFRTLVPEQKLPQFLFDGATQLITVEDIMSMKSGLVDIEFLNLLQGGKKTEKSLEILQRFYTLAIKPGTGNPVHTITNALLLAKIIEQITGKPLEDYAQKIFFGDIPIYGLAFVPFLKKRDDEKLIEASVKQKALEQLLKRFEGSYRSDELIITWQLRAQKNILPSQKKEAWGLQVAGIEALFFIPTDISDDKATFILLARPSCHLQFSKSQFFLQDPSANIHKVLFKKI